MKYPTLFSIEKSIGPLEFIVLKIIWDNDKVTVRNTVNILKPKKNLAYTTVMTVMDNLYKKGFLRREKIKKSYYYSSIIKENIAVSKSLDKLFENIVAEHGNKKILSSYFDLMTRDYKAPVKYSSLLTITFVFLIISIFDLIENLKAFGSFDYFNLLTTEPTLISDKLHLFGLAIFESLPIINIVVTVISLTLIVTFIKKLSSFTNLRRAI